MKKYICLCLIFVFVTLLFIPASAAVFIEPSTRSVYYVTLNTSQLGVIKILIPDQYIQYISFNAEYPINVSGSTFYGYVAGSDTRIRFQPFMYPDYQNGYTYSTLTVNSLIETNLSDNNLSFDNKIFVSIFLILVVVVACLFMKN